MSLASLLLLLLLLLSVSAVPYCPQGNPCGRYTTGACRHGVVRLDVDTGRCECVGSVDPIAPGAEEPWNSDANCNGIEGDSSATVCFTAADCPPSTDCMRSRCAYGYCSYTPINAGEGCDPGPGGTNCLAPYECNEVGQCVSMMRDGACSGYPSAVDPTTRKDCRHVLCDGSPSECRTVRWFGECDDGDPCTSEDRCNTDGECVGRPTDCDDGDDCTIDSCVPGSGCTYRLTDECKPLSPSPQQQQQQQQPGPAAMQEAPAVAAAAEVGEQAASPALTDKTVAIIVCSVVGSIGFAIVLVLFIVAVVRYSRKQPEGGRKRPPRPPPKRRRRKRDADDDDD